MRLPVLCRAPSLVIHFVDLAKNRIYIVSELILRIMRLKPADVADPPDVVTHAIGRHVFPFHLAPRNFLTHGDRFEHGTIRKSAPADVIHLRRAGLFKEKIECPDKVGTVQIIAYLLTLITEYRIWSSRHVALHQKGQK